MEFLFIAGAVVMAVPVIVVAGIVDAAAARRRLLKYWSRSCTGPEWRCSFPDVPKGDIRAFLDLFVSAFDFDKKHRLKFIPSDRIMEVYQALYPPISLADNMEVETFALSLEELYGIGLDRVESWCSGEITLGDLFALTRSSCENADDTG